jgi:hypothetical protein
MVAAIVDSYVMSPPSGQNALDIFNGEWSSRLPGAYAHLTAGDALLFSDPRLAWAIEVLGGVKGRTVLELGPLEGGHTYMLETAGAAHTLAIEANTRAYLKCLIVKEILGLRNSHFLCGDFFSYLQNSNERFDLCLASGVLYHLIDPAGLIGLLSLRTDALYIWSHYYDPSIIEANCAIRDKFSGPSKAVSAGFAHSLFRYEYLTALEWKGFCGGSREYSHWMSRADILACLEFFGFRNILTAHEQTGHPNGPCFAVMATK